VTTPSLPGIRFKLAMGKPAHPWVSAQLGINGKFFVPRLLHRQGRLGTMLVPLWYNKESRMYRFISRFYWTAPNFFHRELSGANVRTLLGAKLWFELTHFRQRRTLPTWEFIARSNDAYQRGLLAALRSRDMAQLRDGPPGIFISWSDISLDAIRFFHGIGWKTVTMQLNCGQLEEDLIAGECARYPSMTEKSYRAPAGFHARTIQEYHETDHVISNSAWGREYLVANGISPEKISLVPFAYEGESERGFSREYPAVFNETRPLRVLHVGQMSLRKGIGRFFEAIQAMRDLPVQFTFVGSIGVPIPPEISANPRVQILGVVPREKVEALYREADVFLFPTLSDAFGLTQLECMAWRLPLIASHHCGDVVRPGINGLRLGEVSVASITEAVRYCLSNPDELSRWSAGCQVPPACTMESFGQALLDIEERLFPGKSLTS
jgi:glycosyltransferase involved in cell wall biosynthesis